MSTWVISPCKRSRVSELLAMLASLGHHAARVVVVTTMPDPIEGDDVAGHADHVVMFEKPGMLFGEWFNLGFDYIADIDQGPRDILCIGSSLLASPALIPKLRDAMRLLDLGMVGPDQFGRVADGQIDIHQHGTRTLENRILANCFMIAGELGLRFDPDFRWWYSDDDLEMQARQIKPVGNVGGVKVTMTHPDGHYLSEQQAIWAAEDRAKFVAKWEKEPW